MATTSTSTPGPAFWFGFEVPWAKLVLGRVVLFGLLACDALLQIRHAPRYGAGGFNVAQLPGLDWIAPSRVVFELAELANAYLFVLIACGVATRRLVPITAILYSWLYFGSQLDSYQHHYLVALILLLACFVPWQRPAGATPSTPVRSWALRLILVQLGIMYLWAAISKMNVAWTDGTTLSTQFSGSLRALVDSTIGIATTAKLVIVVELVLAVTVWIPRAWPIAAPLGLLFHLGIVFTGLEIGLFAVLMIGIYLFVIPDRIIVRIANSAVIEKLRGGLRSFGARFDGGARWLAFGFGLVLGLGLAIACRFESAVRVGIVVTIAMLACVLFSRAARSGRHLAWLGIVQALALATWFVIDRETTIAADYYKFWGGTSRRLKDTDAAEHAYRRLVQIAPADATGHFQLGRILIDRGATIDALDELHLAEANDGQRTRAYVLEARWLAAHGRKVEAIAKIREAIALVPNDTDARNLLGVLTAGTPSP